MLLRLAVVVVVVTGAQGESCSRVQTRAMQQSFTDCSRNISETQHTDQASRGFSYIYLVGFTFNRV